jgi:hypothetical protein
MHPVRASLAVPGFGHQGTLGGVGEGRVSPCGTIEDVGIGEHISIRV